MPCNTAHHYAARISEAVDVPLLDMVALSVGRLQEMGVGTFGILGSPALRLTGVFDRALAKRGPTAIYPRGEAVLLAAIGDIKAATGHHAQARAALAAAADALRDAGAEALLVACTEFSLIADAIGDGGPVLDTLDVLADEVVAFASAPARDVAHAMVDA